MSARGSSAWASSADSAKTKKKKNRGADKKDGANTFSLVTTPGRVVTRDADDDDDELLVLGETNEAGKWLSDQDGAGGNFPQDTFHAKRKLSLKLVYLTNFLSATGFSLLLTTIFQYLDDEAGDEAAKDFMGVVIGAFSVGQIIGAPFWGSLTSRTTYLKVFVGSIVVRMLGNLLYAFVHAFHGTSGKEYTMVFARFIVGFGAGSMAVCNAYVAAATTLEERTGAMGLVAASGGLGFIVGPLLSIAFGGVQGDSNDVVLLNYETLPAYLAALMCLLNIWVMVKNFQEFRLQEMGLGDGDGGADLPSKGEGAERRTAEPNAKPTNEDDIEANVIASTQPPLKHSAIAVLLSVYFLVYVCLSLSETVSVPLAITEFGWSKQKADIDVGILTGCMGLEVVIVFIMAKPLAMKYGERQVLLYGLVVAIIGQLITVPFGSLPASVGEVQNATANATAAATGDMGTAWSIFGPSMLFSGGHDFGVEEGTSGLRSSSGPSSSANTTEATGGCHEYVWCDTTPHVSLFQFGLSAFVINSAWPLANVMIFGLYSKVLGPIDQGVWMGLLNSCGSLARMVGPVLIMKLFVTQGPRTMYLIVSAVMVLAVVIAGGGYRLLVPQAPAGGAGDASLGDNNDDDDDDDVELLSIDMVEPDNVYD